MPHDAICPLNASAYDVFITIKNEVIMTNMLDKGHSLDCRHV